MIAKFLANRSRRLKMTIVKLTNWATYPMNPETKALQKRREDSEINNLRNFKGIIRIARFLPTTRIRCNSNEKGHRELNILLLR